MGILSGPIFGLFKNICILRLALFDYMFDTNCELNLVFLSRVVLRAFLVLGST